MKVVAFDIFVGTFYCTLNQDMDLYLLVDELVVIVTGVVSVVVIGSGIALDSHINLCPGAVSPSTVSLHGLSYHIGIVPFFGLKVVKQFSVLFPLGCETKV